MSELSEDQAKLKQMYEKTLRSPLEEWEFLLISKVVTPADLEEQRKSRRWIRIIENIFLILIISAWMLNVIIWWYYWNTYSGFIFIILSFATEMLILVNSHESNVLRKRIFGVKRLFKTEYSRIYDLTEMVRMQEPISITRIAKTLEISKTTLFNCMYQWVEEYGLIDNDDIIISDTKRKEEFISRLLKELILGDSLASQAIFFRKENS